ncbi:MAG: trigger factor, partial [Candidatus Nanopelagicales bacterium]
MKSSVETLSPTRVKLTVEVPFEEMSDSLAAAYTRISSQVTIPGFRKGKVPPRVIDQRVGRGSVLEEAVNEALPAAYDAAITENEVVAVGQPQVEVTELEDNEKLVFTAEVDIRPEFELPEYAGLAVTVADTEVTDEKVTEQLDELRKRFATALPVERAAQDDDLVLIDVEGTLDGEKQEEYSATALSYEVGSAGMVNGADEAIRGLSEGETATFPFTPEEGELAGKELSITVSVQGVRERSLPDADDEFAQLASEFDTLEELRGDLQDRVARMALVEQGMEAREKALEQLLETVE